MKLENCWCRCWVFAGVDGLLCGGGVSLPSREHSYARKTSGWTWVQR